jgi:hypothetical protein
MKEVIQIISIVLYFIVGIISLIMAKKNIISNKFLPFHEKISETTWDEVDKPIQSIILALMKIAGFGFLTVGLMLIIFPIVNYFVEDNFLKFAAPILSMVFCFGLFLINYNLSKKTKAATPWRGSLYAIILLLIGVVLSCI